ncbi:MAG: serine/threonine protein kinase [Candidatus Sumerlaeia bacterium]|nr:serine/threonine protein kinase [Candidatus Sumerlaeia bacterium]
MADPAVTDGDRIGPYRIVGVLARGATSEVVKGIDEELNRVAAIKLLSPEFIKDPEALARFEQESRALTELNHPNIAQILETGVTWDGLPYFIMEFVDGRSLKEIIDDKIELPFSQQIELIMQAAQGLDAAFHRNIIHRDIKPANLMVTQDWTLKVVDFGLAKVIREDAYKSVAGRLMGTPRYMAPEVALGRTADWRSDIYSLGATFYHLLTGRPPFDGETPAAVMMQHVNSPLPPPYLINPAIPADVCEIVQKAMAKDPADRYQDYDLLLQDLRQARVARVHRERILAEEAHAREVAAAEAAKAAAAAAAEAAASAESGAEPHAAEGKMISGAGSLYEAYDARMTRRRILILSLLLIVGAGAMAYMLSPRGAETAGGGLRGIIRALLAHLGAGKVLSPEELYYNRYQETLVKLDYLSAAVKEYMVRTGRDIKTLDDLIKRRIIGKTDFTDGFGGPILYEPVLRRIRTAGPDKIMGSADDFLADENGKIIAHPPEPEIADQQEFIATVERRTR